MSSVTRKRGKVYLVGAGPGDKGLLTLRGREVLLGADMIVYDYLANPAHLDHAKPGARKICVGKGFRYHRLSQDRIHQLIIAAARKGQNVVRLKGGDPYLFGRGGEEALFLRKQDVDFEVIPGVTSATACAAYAGIPLTHRDASSSITFLTGHKAEDQGLDTIPWNKIASIGGTLVIYMGFYNLEKIARHLILAGMSARTKAAVIEWGTLPTQKSCAGTLTTIASEVKKHKLKPPSIIIIGEVVAYREHLGWYEKLPLFGKRIAVTRMREKSHVLWDKLEKLGAQVVEWPLIEIKPLSSFKLFDETIKRISGYDWVVFTSAYGVEAFFKRLKGRFGKDARALGSLRIACVGPGTAESLRQNGIEADLLPAHYETKAIVDAFKKKFGRLNKKRILLLRTDIAPPLLEDGLRRLCAQVDRVTAYHTRQVTGSLKKAAKSIAKNEVACVTFTSSSAVSHFAQIKKDRVVRNNVYFKKLEMASIGPVTSQALRACGFKVACQAKRFTIEGLVEALTDKYGQRKKR